MKEVCRLIRAARGHWDAHHNGAARLARTRALRLYARLTPDERTRVPQALRVWLRYRSEKYYGTHGRPPKKRPVREKRTRPPREGRRGTSDRRPGE
ncbi:MAG: Precorrin-3B methylase [Proteobacteria bacterium]|nr:Precorrin-3B methylase [Pseudomonadota bacterium]